MVNKTNFNIIMSTISKYWKCVCPLAVTTNTMHAFLIVFMRATCTNYRKLSDAIPLMITGKEYKMRDSLFRSSATSRFLFLKIVMTTDF